LSNLVLSVERVVSWPQRTHWRHVREKSSEISNHAIDIFVVLDETMPLAVSDIADHLFISACGTSTIASTTYIESKELQPLCKVADLVRVGEQLFSLIKEDFDTFRDAWLILDQLTHGKSVVNRSSQIGVVSFVGRREERWQSLSRTDTLLHWVEARLNDQDLARSYSKERRRPTLVIPLFNP
jgi:hypothetical protein